MSVKSTLLFTENQMGETLFLLLSIHLYVLFCWCRLYNSNMTREGVRYRGLSERQWCGQERGEAEFRPHH